MIELAVRSGPVTLPPRPNLGPEPWPESVSTVPPAVLLAVALGVLALLGLGLFWRRGRSRPAASVPASSEPEPKPEPEPTSLSPRDRLIRAARSARDLLADRFGETWAAKTTEELADEASLAEWLGPSRTEALFRLLKQADRAKFAGSVPGQGEAESDDWDAWVAGLSALAGPTSRIKGR